MTNNQQRIAQLQDELLVAVESKDDRKLEEIIDKLNEILIALAQPRGRRTYSIQ